jgi:hypothetical protein
VHRVQSDHNRPDTYDSGCWSGVSERDDRFQPLAAQQLGPWDAEHVAADLVVWGRWYNGDARIRQRHRLTYAGGAAETLMDAADQLRPRRA